MSQQTIQALSTISGDFRGKDIVSLDQFTADDLVHVFRIAEDMKRRVLRKEPTQLLAGYIVGLLFFEPSSRTYGSFSAAVKWLGGQTIDVLNPDALTSVSKGETFEDTIRVFEAYSDALVLRHPNPGAAKVAAHWAAQVPILNAGDGNNEHPTQTVLDLFTLYQHCGRLDNLKGLMVGDVLNSRTIHSLIRGLSLFPNNTVYLLAPDGLQLSNADRRELSARGANLVEITREEEIPKDCDFWYWTRIQKERFVSPDDYTNAQNNLLVATSELLNKYARPDTALLDPLPRVSSIDPALDNDPRALYLRSQIRNGVYTRMALLALILDRI